MRFTTLALLMLGVILGSMSLVHAVSVYDHHKSYVGLISSINYQKQVIKSRENTKSVLIIHFYKMKDGKSVELAKEIDQFAIDYRGVFSIASVNCEEERVICEKEKVDSFPSVKVYPPLPLPSIDVKQPAADKSFTQEIYSVASRYLANNVVEITAANADTFTKEHPSVPKVFLFTDKKGIPVIFKALSVSLEGKQFFGIVRSTEDSLVKKYQVKKFPTILIVQSGERKNKVYSGEMKYVPIFEFLNVYSQTFVPGGSQQSSATKSWLSELVPEMHLKSHRDICLGHDALLCVILINKGKPQPAHIDALKNLHTQYDRQMERGLAYKFMWLDSDVEKEWATSFKFEGTPKVIILNPGKRKRVLEHEGDITVESLKTTFEKINGGDARFRRITDKDIPEFSAIRTDL